MEYVSYTEKDGIAVFKVVESTTGKTKGNVSLDFNKILNTANKIKSGDITEEKQIQLAKSINITIQEQVEAIKSSTSGMNDYVEFSNLKQEINNKLSYIKKISEGNKNILDSTAIPVNDIVKLFEEKYKALSTMKKNGYDIQFLNSSGKRTFNGGFVRNIIESSAKEAEETKAKTPTLSSGISADYYFNSLKYEIDDVGVWYSKSSKLTKDFKEGVKNTIEEMLEETSKAEWINIITTGAYGDSDFRKEKAVNFFETLRNNLKSKNLIDDSVVLRSGGLDYIELKKDSPVEKSDIKTTKREKINLFFNYENYCPILSDETIKELKKEFKNISKVGGDFYKEFIKLFDGIDLEKEISELNEKIESKKDSLGIFVSKIVNNFYYKEGERITNSHKISHVVNNISFESEETSVVKKILEDSNGVYSFAGNLFNRKSITTNDNFKCDIKKNGQNIYKYKKDTVDFSKELRDYYENAFKVQLSEAELEDLKEIFIDEFISSRSTNSMPLYTNSIEAKDQHFLNINNYYDLYTVNAPYIKLGFKTGREKTTKGYKNTYCFIDSVNTPFIKSMHVTDNGARIFEINLYDRDFNTELSNFNGTLEQLLIKCLGIDSEEATAPDITKIKEMKLDENTYGNVAGFKGDTEKTGNLIIQYGYSDYNPKVEEIIDLSKRQEMTKSKDSYARMNGTIYGTTGKSGSYAGISDDSGKTKTRGERWWETSTDVSDATNRTIINQVNSPNNSTIRSNVTNCIITGFETKFTEGGIYYSIKAIEFSESELSAYKIFQRHTNLVGSPKELMYMTMNIIEELFGDSLEIKFYGNVDDIIEQEEENANGEFIKKQYQINLGSKEARAMYEKKDGDNVGLLDLTTKENKSKIRYKSVKSLISDLCAVMPAYEEDRSNSVKVTDEDGNTTEAIASQKSYRRMTYAYIDNTIYLYYQRPQKVKSIRRYTWGPANPEKTVIKSVDVKTQNEYSLLSSMKFITREKGEYKNNIITRNGTQYTLNGKIKSKEDCVGADYIPNGFKSSDDTRKEISMAYAQALYDGKITILGDPFYNFGKFLQPYSYPIFLDFKLPRTEMNSSGNWNDKSGYSHYMSGFYVVTSIEHNISESGFTTILGVMSYSSLVKDVLVDYMNNNISIL